MAIFKQISGWALLGLIPVLWYALTENGVGYGAAVNVIIIAVSLYLMTGSAGEAR